MLNSMFITVKYKNVRCIHNLKSFPSLKADKSAAYTPVSVGQADESAGLPIY